MKKKLPNEGWPFHSKNEGYFEKITEYIRVIKEKWPTIECIPPLPQFGDTGHNKMIGFGAPFGADAFDENVLEPDMEMSCFINFFWIDMYFNPLPHVPLDHYRVLDLAATTTAKPGLMKGGPAVVHTNCVHGAKMSVGNLVMLSPIEMPHSILHNIYTAIMNGAQESELARWMRVLLSYPVVLVKRPTADEKFAEANSLRGDFENVAKNVVFTVRQLAYNIHGLKK